MAATKTLSKVVYQMKLNNGVDMSGNVKTVNVSLGTINANAADDDKALAITNAIGPCLSKAIYFLARVDTSGIEAE